MLGIMSRPDSAIPVGLQALTDVTNLCARECVSNYRVFDRCFRLRKHFRTESLVKDQRKRCEGENWVLTQLFDVSAFGICRLNANGLSADHQMARSTLADVYLWPISTFASRSLWMISSVVYLCFAIIHVSRPLHEH